MPGTRLIQAFQSLPVLAVLSLLAVPRPVEAQDVLPNPDEAGVAAEAAENDQAVPVFLEPVVALHFIPAKSDDYLGMLALHGIDYEGIGIPGGHFGINVNVALLHWLEVGGGVHTTYGSWTSSPEVPTDFEVIGLDLTAHVRFNLWMMESWSAERPGAYGTDWGVFVELAFGAQIPIVVLRNTPDASAGFLLRPMGGFVFRFLADLHWMFGGGYAVVFGPEAWDGNPAPAVGGGFLMTGIGVNLN